MGLLEYLGALMVLVTYVVVSISYKQTSILFFRNRVLEVIIGKDYGINKSHKKADSVIWATFLAMCFIVFIKIITEFIF